MTDRTRKILDDLAALRGAAEEEAASARAAAGVEAWRVRFLGRRSAINNLGKAVASSPEDERPTVGKAVNETRSALEALLATLQARAAAGAALPGAGVDYTLPGVPPHTGNLHPLTRTYYEIAAFFAALGFAVAHGPEVEDDYHNFGALNFPADHPSRDAQDTLYLSPTWLLRTHTSPGQIRVMSSRKPPLRVIIPGRCFRADAVDASHYPVFHQVEGLLVDERASLGDLKGTLAAFASYIFGPGTRMRFRPHFFPFTEPSAEVDISCVVCGGAGCGTCGGKGWLEIAGTGMVHPNVFRNVGYDPEKWVGYAFGMGVERIAMLKYGVNDIRLFYDNDLRFLKQF